MNRFTANNVAIPWAGVLAVPHTADFLVSAVSISFLVYHFLMNNAVSVREIGCMQPTYNRMQVACNLKQYEIQAAAATMQYYK